LSQRGSFVELFLNNHYLGVYSFNEPIDRKQLDLRQNGGILYKAEEWSDETKYQGTQIEPGSSLYWGGFELKHPNNSNKLIWEPLYELINLVAYADDSTFIQTIDGIIDIDNIIDYFIFINMIQANDNWGKNIFICRYDESHPLFFIPWDLDLTFGNTNSIWTSETPNDILLTNNLFKRLFELNVNNYIDKVRLRWDEIYQDNLLDNIVNDLVKNNKSLTESNAGYRENKRWDLATVYAVEIENIKTWLSMRLIFFDNYIKSNY